MSLSSLALILFVALILFGPEDLPVIARTLGKMVYQVRKFMNEVGREFQAAIDTPSKVVNEALKDKPKPKQTEKQQEDKPEEILTYEEDTNKTASEVSVVEESNPLSELPNDVVSYPKESQAGE